MRSTLENPTKNLDPETSERILTLPENLNKEGILVVYATENPVKAKQAPRQLILHEGSLSGDKWMIPHPDTTPDTGLYDRRRRPVIMGLPDPDGPTRALIDPF